VKARGVIRYVRVPSGFGNSTVVTRCDHQDCAGRIITQDCTMALAQFKGAQHLTTHEQADKAS
jgi:hypothetical protein